MVVAFFSLLPLRYCWLSDLLHVKFQCLHALSVILLLSLWRLLVVAHLIFSYTLPRKQWLVRGRASVTPMTTTSGDWRDMVTVAPGTGMKGVESHEFRVYGRSGDAA